MTSPLIFMLEITSFVYTHTHTHTGVLDGVRLLILAVEASP